VRLVLIGTLAAFAGFMQSPELSGTATLDQPPALLGRTFAVAHEHASLRLHCGSAAPCLGTVTLGRGRARYRIAAGRTANVRVRAPRGQRANVVLGKSRFLVHLGSRPHNHRG
jgi:hypothetical protein